MICLEVLLAAPQNGSFSKSQAANLDARSCWKKFPLFVVGSTILTCTGRLLGDIVLCFLPLFFKHKHLANQLWPSFCVRPYVVETGCRNGSCTVTASHGELISIRYITVLPLLTEVVFRAYRPHIFYIPSQTPQSDMALLFLYPGALDMNVLYVKSSNCNA